MTKKIEEKNEMFTNLLPDHIVSDRSPSVVMGEKKDEGNHQQVNETHQQNTL